MLPVCFLFASCCSAFTTAVWSCTLFRKLSPFPTSPATLRSPTATTSAASRAAVPSRCFCFTSSSASRTVASSVATVSVSSRNLRSLRVAGVLTTGLCRAITAPPPPPCPPREITAPRAAEASPSSCPSFGAAGAFRALASLATEASAASRSTPTATSRSPTAVTPSSLSNASAAPICRVASQGARLPCVADWRQISRFERECESAENENS